MVKEEQKNVINIDLTGVDPVYSNMVNIIHGPFDFTFNFVKVSPPTGDVVARVMMSPQHAKALLKALQENIGKYENSFGEIKDTPDRPAPSGPTIGFVN